MKKRKESEKYVLPFKVNYIAVGRGEKEGDGRRRRGGGYTDVSASSRNCATYGQMNKRHAVSA